MQYVKSQRTRLPLLLDYIPPSKEDIECVRNSFFSIRETKIPCKWKSE